ncbi:hypothetical protein A8135_02325 [Legionella jamestowniensis]|uniref:Uncharacterized protein n=1 Tax=Legionella jamestowniensis TaxID=455 RepID=A0ABX2XSU9_9GAMM|nr:hypothetical protein [Legionella jamestowniensis]OCH97695.1 hypothetical protein A8135_02325 [Legionella jamestowniensis]
MVQFFRHDFAAEVDDLVKRMEVLRQALQEKSGENAENNKDLATKFTIAATDINTVISNYKSAIYNSTNESEKRQLVNEFKDIVVCLETLRENPQTPRLNELIANLKKTNERSPSKEALARIGDALATMFWLGVFMISIVSLTVSMSTIPADPLGGIAFSMVSFGLMSYSFYNMLNHFDGVFENKYFYENSRQINADDISFLSNIKDAYTPAAETSTLAV